MACKMKKSRVGITVFSRVSTTPATPADTSPIPKLITVRSRQVSHFSLIINSEGTCHRAVDAVDLKGAQ